MKIIKKGKIREQLLRTDCRHCGSMLEEEEGKLKWESDMRNEELARAKCPVCKTEIFFYRK